MMKRILQIVLLGLAAQLPAVVVPQTSAADYIFTAPRLTNHIHGVLIDTTNAYGVIRSEDVDWLREAFAERESILSGHLPQPRRISLGVGPTVKREDAPRRRIETEWLDGDAPLLAGCRFYSDAAFTNVYEQTYYTNGVSNAFSVIEMPMTNGTTSVYTNRWTCDKVIPYTVTATNITQGGVDLFHGVDGEPFPVYSNATKLAWWRQHETRMPNVRYIADARDALRGTVRLADVGSEWTNSTVTISQEDWGGSPRPAETNYGYGVTYEFASDGSLDYSSRSATAAFTADVPTRFDSSLVTTGGASRVSIEAAYAYCWFSFVPTDLEGEERTSVVSSAVVRLSNPSLDMSCDTAFCRVFIDAYSLCSTCASAAGVQAPPQSLSYREPYRHTAVWGVHVSNIAIIYRITPSVKLPDW